MNVALIDRMIQSDCQDEGYSTSPEHKVAMALVGLTGCASDLCVYALDPIKRRLIKDERDDLLKARLAIDLVLSALEKS